MKLTDEAILEIAKQYRHYGGDTDILGLAHAVLEAARAGCTPINDEWAYAQEIADEPLVNEALRAFSEDSTGDNATCLVREVLRAKAAKS